MHNLRELTWNENTPYSWASTFSNTIKKAIIINDHNTIINYQKLDGANKSVPTSEHFIPLLYILALQRNKESTTIFNEDIIMGSIDMMGVIIR